jgi:hypothetical protein
MACSGTALYIYIYIYMAGVTEFLPRALSFLVTPLDRSEVRFAVKSCPLGDVRMRGPSKSCCALHGS